MQIYIVRHGDAYDPGAPWITSDEMRPLTDTGRDEVALMAHMLQRLDVKPTAILASPLVRAQQTAEIFADAFGVPGRVGTCDDMAPGGSLDGVLRDLDRLGDAGAVILTGHMPGVGRLAGYLAWQDPDIVLPFRTGEICRIDVRPGYVTPGTGDFRWLIPPRVARKLLGDS